MSTSELDFSILKTIITNKKYALEFVHECNEKLFDPDNWRFAKLIIDYIRIYRDVPTKRVILERVKSSKNEAFYESVNTTYSKLETFQYDDKEYKHDLEKIKARFSEKLISNLKNNLERDGSIDVKKSLNELQSVVSNIKSVNQVKAYDQGSLRESIEDFTNRYKAKLKDPTYGIGLSTGYTFFDFATSGLRPGEMLLVGAETGAGKCHAKGQGILKYDGSVVKVEDIKIGDLIMGPHGPRKVLKTNAGHDYMYDIIPLKGKPWRVNADHILTLVMTDTDEIIDVSVKEHLSWLPQSRKKYKAKLLRSAAEFDNKKDLRLDPYFMGVLLGDGSFSDSSIKLTSADKPIIDYAKNICNSFGLTLSLDKNAGKAQTFRFSGIKGKKNPIASILEGYNLRGKSCEYKFIPFDYKTSSKQDRLQILAGLLDTDGHHNGRGGFDYISKSKQLADDVVFVARSVGLAAYVKECQKFCQTGGGGTYHRVCISGFTDVIPCKLPRKQASPRRQIKDVLRIGFKIIPTGIQEEYYGFTLDGDGRYLLDDFTITHNSSLLMNMAINMWMNGNTIDMEKDFKEGCDVLYFSLEMPKDDLLERVLSRLGMVQQKSIRDAKLDGEEQKRLTKAMKFISNYPWDFEIVDVPRGASIETIELIMNDITARRRKPKVVVVDYLTLMDYTEQELDDWLKQGKISEQLHEFGRIHEIVMLSAVQLNDPKAGNGKAPESQVGLHRIGRSKMIMHNANFGIQIEKRVNEEQYPDMSLHLIKSRRTELTRGKIYKNFSCCALLNDPHTLNDATIFDVDDISDRMSIFGNEANNS